MALMMGWFCVWDRFGRCRGHRRRIGSIDCRIGGYAGISALDGLRAYLATKAEREVNEAEIGRERREIESKPEEEMEELSLFYQLKGVPEDEAHVLAQRLVVNRM